MKIQERLERWLSRKFLVFVTTVFLIIFRCLDNPTVAMVYLWVVMAFIGGNTFSKWIYTKNNIKGDDNVRDNRQSKDF